jgi:hypothetical protein
MYLKRFSYDQHVSEIMNHEFIAQLLSHPAVLDELKVPLPMYSLPGNRCQAMILWCPSIASVYFMNETTNPLMPFDKFDNTR